MSVEKFRGPTDQKEASWLGWRQRDELQVFATFSGVELNPYPYLLPPDEMARMAVSQATEAVLDAPIFIDHPKSSLRRLGSVANGSVARVNQILANALPKRDYVQGNYVGIVGSIGFIAEGVLHCAQLNRSGLEVMDGAGDLRFVLCPLAEATTEEVLDGSEVARKLWRLRHYPLPDDAIVTAYTPGAAVISQNRRFKEGLVAGDEHLELSSQFESAVEESGALIVIRNES